MDNTETMASLGTQDRTETNQITKTQRNKENQKDE